MDKIQIIDVNPDNVREQTLFCIKDIKKPEFENKKKWFEKAYKDGLRIKILRDQTDRPIAFIEYVPAEFAWRPVDTDNFMFIHCMYVYSNKDKKKGYGSILVKTCEDEAREKNMHGVATMTSKGSWIADSRLFEKMGYIETEKKDRFELLVKKFDENFPKPKFIDWTQNRKNYLGWHLLYADQCPWNEPSALALKKTATEYGIDLQIKKIDTVQKAKAAPSGFAVFNLLHDGKLLEDHYLSATRFKNILKKELSL
ncbi:MAG: GNAT family N-acetyltransferase [Bacteroidales bacterium]|nr:GNAT family N-acetyltransferase [Bacteroidales bacterium]